MLDSSALAKVYSPDYATARTRFRAAAERLGWSGTAYPIDVLGPDGEALTIDVAVSATAASDRTLVVSSGLHGVEGFLGSAVQLAVLERWLQPPGPPTGVRCVFLHALNPYGFAWSRRVDAENIDPNRNFLADGGEFRGSPPGYARLDAFLNPRRPPAAFDLFYLKACVMLIRHGRAALKEAIVAGQYDFPRGLFYGGAGPSRTQSILREHLGSWLGDAASVIHLDFHAGLGAPGEYKLLADVAPTPAQRQWIEQTFGASAFEESDARGIAYPTRGSLCAWCAAQDLAPDYLLLVAECGTYGNLRVLAGLRAENRAHHWGDWRDAATLRTKARLRELFCPADESWRRRALAGGIGLVERAVGRA